MFHVHIWLLKYCVWWLCVVWCGWQFHDILLYSIILTFLLYYFAYFNSVILSSQKSYWFLHKSLHIWFNPCAPFWSGRPWKIAQLFHYDVLMGQEGLLFNNIILDHVEHILWFFHQGFWYFCPPPWRSHWGGGT